MQKLFSFVSYLPGHSGSFGFDKEALQVVLCHSHITCSMIKCKQPSFTEYQFYFNQLNFEQKIWWSVFHWNCKLDSVQTALYRSDSEFLIGHFWYFCHVSTQGGQMKEQFISHLCILAIKYMFSERGSKVTKNFCQCWQCFDMFLQGFTRHSSEHNQHVCILVFQAIAETLKYFGFASDMI